MNDDELNELIACHDYETAIFRDIDFKRERDALEAWRQAAIAASLLCPSFSSKNCQNAIRLMNPLISKIQKKSLKVVDNVAGMWLAITMVSMMTHGQWCVS
jgi:hypothetical protein